MSEKDDILIDAYLRGNLTSEDKLLLEQKLKEKDFKQKYNEATLLLEVLKEEDAKKLKSRMQSIEKAEFGTNKSQGIFNTMKLGILALIIIFSGLIYFLIFTSSDNSEEIYATFYEPYPNVIDPIVKGSSNVPSIYQFYELKDYSKVINDLTSRSSLDIDEQFYLASSYLGENDYTKASTQFEALKNSAKYADPSQWYLALICINQNQSSCEEMIYSIASDKSNMYSGKAKELLEKMGK